MAAPTFAEAFTKGKAYVNILQKASLFGYANSPNLVALARTAEEAVKAEGQEATDLSQASAAIRSGMNAILGNPRAVMDPVVRLIAHCSDIQSSAQTIEGMLDDIQRYMAGTSERIKSRVFVDGAFSAGSVTGNGRLKRCLQDRYGFSLEARLADVYKARVSYDQNTGTKKGREIWRLSPQSFIDQVEFGASGRGSGLEREFAAANGDDTTIQNPSFSDKTGGTDAAPTGISGWTSDTAVIGDGTDYQFDRTNYYQESDNEGGSPGSLRIYLSRVLSQKLSLTNQTIDQNFPYYCGLLWNRQVGSWTGDLKLELGGISKTVTAAAQTGWQFLELPNANDTDLWPRNWKAQDPAIKITTTKTSGAGTWINVDRLIFRPFYGYAGWFFLPVSGSTPWLLDDYGTITDTETGAVLQLWFHRAYGRSLPHATGGSITIADPT